MNQRQTSLLTILGIVSALGQAETQIVEMPPINMCGRTLAHNLAFACNSIKDPYYENKESGPANIYKFLQWSYSRQTRKDNGRLSITQARSMSEASSGYRDVFHKCCSKSCTIDELMSYCWIFNTGQENSDEIKTKYT